jgi:hypothetical protein
MKILLKILFVASALMTVGNLLSAQSEQKVYAGAGVGFDYGGIGGKIEYLPVKYFGLLGGAGYNILSLGWNVGATYKILPDKFVSPNIMVLYGYNATMRGLDSYASQYEMTSYGVSLGMNLDILLGSRGNKLSIGLFVPIRSSKYMDNYERIRNDPNMESQFPLLPVAVSVGYNFRL